MTDPYALFGDWFAEAQAAEVNDANACALATVELRGDELPLPDVRIVLMKSYDAGGFLLFTNYDSAKGRQIRQCPMAALDFHWKSLRKQVRVRGSIGRATLAESDAYFATRPRESQLSAWASSQSEPLDARETFEARLDTMAARFPGEVPRPNNWGGYRLVPNSIEFWEDRPGRQHWRTRFVKTPGGWESGLLYP
ncbi:pyridoxamine 5'-phosphate oxidase [Sandaracinobacter neustonicus]|uniref:Pyridoxine/pyridoxamine 5'-phosphate oxidase n=1 Tax=Sandaracinobacter neustonicus TaxID=1715348 RepID=A0A501XHF8_9SPHN|nr:pyridoxamine 5'-phosphate oxidase [Sandaracinobacter neustonicus]TPE60071.1 pyridoxamine 5'-phosphate oxidase [Sandaracinobacter neustonicus]